MTFPKILKFADGCGKVKFDKGSHCHIMCSTERFCEHGMAAARSGVVADIDIHEISSQNLTIDASKIVMITDISSILEKTHIFLGNYYILFAI